MPLSGSLHQDPAGLGIWAGLYVGASLVFSIAATVAGPFCGRCVLQPQR